MRSRDGNNCDTMVDKRGHGLLSTVDKAARSYGLVIDATVTETVWKSIGKAIKLNPCCSCQRRE